MSRFFIVHCVHNIKHENISYSIHTMQMVYCLNYRMPFTVNETTDGKLLIIPLGFFSHKISYQRSNVAHNSNEHTSYNNGRLLYSKVTHSEQLSHQLQNHNILFTC